MSRFSDRLDLSFKYTSAAKTTIAKTIKREQNRLKQLAAAQAAEVAAEARRQEEQLSNIADMRQQRGGRK